MGWRTIFLIDANDGYQRKFYRYYNQQGYHVISARGLGDALDVFGENNTGIDLVVIAEKIGGDRKDAGNLLKEIRAYCEIPVIVLMDSEDFSFQETFYRMGADDCVSREMPMELLRLKLEAVLNRIYGKERYLTEGILELDLERRILRVDGREVEITVKEFELLQFFMVNKHAVQSRNQILAAVWGINYEGSDRVVDSLVKKLRIKLGNAASYIRTAYGLGYYFEEKSSRT